MLAKAVSRLESSLVDWYYMLMPELYGYRLAELDAYLREEQAAGKLILPEPWDIFKALSATPFEATRVVIVGQEPYHQPGIATGLAFAANPEKITARKLPGSLRNIILELKRNLGLGIASPNASYVNTSLLHWAFNGVLLLNASLTVEAGKPGSHLNRGWEVLTTRLIELLNTKKRRPVVFILMGRAADELFSPLIDSPLHYVIKTAHPSPLSAHNGFFFSACFNECNEFLKSVGEKPIPWEGIFR